MLLAAGSAAAQPAAPTIDTIALGEGALTVAWTAPSAVTEITAYDLRYILTSADETVASNWTVLDSVWTAGPLHYVLTGLTNDSKYDVQMRTVTSQDGSWSATTEATPAEVGSTRATAVSLPLDTPVAATLSKDDVDFFEIVLGSATGVALYTMSTLSTVGELQDSNGNYLDGSNEEKLPYTGGLGNFLMFSDSRSAATYYLKVQPGGASGSYRVIARAVTDTSSRANAEEVSLDGTAFGIVGSSGDEDFFKIVLAQDAGVVVRSVTSRELFDYPADTDDSKKSARAPAAAGSTSSLDTKAELQNSTGTKLLGSDDGYLPTEPQDFVLRSNLTAGTYYVKVGAYGTDTGVYWLELDTVTEPGSTTASAVPLVIGEVGGGKIDPASDVDYFRLDVAQTGHLYLRGVSDALAIDGALLASDGTDTGTHVYEETFSSSPNVAGFTIAGRFAAGTYYLKVNRSTSATATATGAYTVKAVEDARLRRLATECSGSSSDIDDRAYKCQWHLKNTGQFGGLSGLDIDVESVWEGGNLGTGSVVRVVDDGMDQYHEDLSANVDSRRNHDYGGGTDVFDGGASHGTSIAGVIAARNNSTGGRGVAPEAKLHGLALLGNATDANAADAMTREMSAVAVSNNSWGPADSAEPKPAPAVWEKAIDSGVASGFGGRGVFYVWAGGNGYSIGDYSTLDEYANYYGVTTVCAVNDSGQRSSYSEWGANLWVCAPSNDGSDNRGIFTTDNYSRYVDAFGGTSAAAAVVSGVAALVRAENSNLGWRDVKLILAASARKIDRFNRGWIAGARKYGSPSERYAYNHEYGFGLVDADAAVSLARRWSIVPRLIRTAPVENAVSLTIPDATGGGKKSVTATSSGTVASSIAISSTVEFVEFVEVTASFDAPSFRDLQIELWSPSGTYSTLTESYSSKSLVVLDGSVRFGSARHLGENPDGVWTLRLVDLIGGGGASELESWSIRFYGHNRSSPGPTGGGGSPGAPSIRSIGSGPGSLAVVWSAPASAAGAISSYDVSYRRTGATDWVEVVGAWTSGAGSERLAYTIAGLVDEASYDVRVRAVGAAGPGPWSAVSTASTGGSPPPPPRPPGAAFEIDVDCDGDLCIAGTGTPVRFTDTSSGYVRTRRWSFGDGRQSRSASVAHAWRAPGFYTVTLTVSDGTTASTASRVFRVDASDPAGTCRADATTICLRDSRYRVRARWWTGGHSAADGEAPVNAANVVYAGTNETGLFWFVDRENWEILIKVLDGCSINGSVWVFGASTTDLGYLIEVTDTIAGKSREYRNEPGRPAPAITDVAAFQGSCAATAAAPSATTDDRRDDPR